MGVLYAAYIILSCIGLLMARGNMYQKRTKDESPIKYQVLQNNIGQVHTLKGQCVSIVYNEKPCNCA